MISHCYELETLRASGFRFFFFVTALKCLLDGTGTPTVARAETHVLPALLPKVTMILKS